MVYESCLHTLVSLSGGMATCRHSARRGLSSNRFGQSAAIGSGYAESITVIPNGRVGATRTPGINVDLLAVGSCR
jgi:hypothetical protein